MPVYGEEGEPGKQGLILQPQDQEAPVRQLAVQEGVVGGREAIPQAPALYQSPQDHREEWPRCGC